MDHDLDTGAPICPACGVTALPAETADTADTVDSSFVCENPDCEAFGDPIGA